MTIYGPGKNTPSGSTATSVTWSRAACDVGNTVVLDIGHQGNASVAGVTDNSGGANVWVRVGETGTLPTPSTSQRLVGKWMCKPTVAITSITVTGSAAGYWILEAKDYAGQLSLRNVTVVDGYDSTQSVAANSGDILSSTVGYAAAVAGTPQTAMSGWTLNLADNLGTSTIETWEKTASTTGAQSVHIVNPQHFGLIMAALAPSTGNAAPTITGPSPLNITGPTGNVTFQGNDTDGTISSFACVHLSNTALTTVTPTVGTGVVANPGTDHASVTFPLAGMTANAQYRFGATDSDDDGAVSSQVVALVNVTSSTPTIRPDVTTSGYTVVGGGTAAQALAAGAPSTRYLQSAAPAAGSTGSVPVEPLPPGAVPVNFWVTGHASDSTTALTRTVRLWQGATLIATQAGTINPTTDSTIGRNTTTSETALITDRAALRVDWVVS